MLITGMNIVIVCAEWIEHLLTMCVNNSDGIVCAEWIEHLLTLCVNNYDDIHLV